MLKNYFFPIILACLFTLSGCFGSTFSHNIDYEVYAPAGTTPKIKIGETEYSLNIGDRVEIINTEPSTYTGNPLNFPTCFYSFFAYAGTLMRMGYDPGATLQDGTPKYSSAYQGILGPGSRYIVDIFRDTSNIHHIEVPYGEGGGIFTNSFSKIKLITATSSSNLINIGSYHTQLGDATTRGTALDRTVCFSNNNDPVTFVVAALPEAAPPPTDLTQPPPEPADLGNLDAGQEDLVPIPQEELDKIPGSTLPQGPSQVTTAAQPTGEDKGGSGCMQLAPNSDPTSTAWVWLTTLCVTGWVIGRRKWLINRR